jgi:hypothetical protein
MKFITPKLPLYRIGVGRERARLACSFPSLRGKLRRATSMAAREWPFSRFNTLTLQRFCL